jgi:hypothetical protein
VSSTIQAPRPQNQSQSPEAKRAALRADALGFIVADLRHAQAALGHIGDGITKVALEDATTEIIDDELWAVVSPRLTAAALSLSVLASRQKYGTHMAALGRRATEAAIDIADLTPQPLAETPGEKAADALKGNFNERLQATINETWPEPLRPALADIPRSATMSAVDRQAREQMLAHWPVDLSAAKLSTLIASKLIEDMVIRLEVLTASVRAQRDNGQYLYIEDAGAAFFALRSTGRAAMFLAQAAVRNGAGIIPGAPASEGFVEAAKSICHGLRLISVKDFELYQSQQPNAKIPDWVGEVRVAKVAPTEGFNRDLMNAKCALIFRPRTAPQATQSSPAPA